MMPTASGRRKSFFPKKNPTAVFPRSQKKTKKKKPDDGSWFFSGCCDVSHCFWPSFESQVDEEEVSRRPRSRGSKNAAFGREFEVAVRAGISEVVRDFGWSQKSTSAEVVEVYREDQDSAGDIDAYLKTEGDVFLRDVLPKNCVLNESAVHDLELPLKKGTLLIYEAKTSWNSGTLVRKDQCFDLFWKKAGRPPVLTIFLFGGQHFRGKMWTTPHLLEGHRCSFFTPKNTVFAWTKTANIYSWAADLRLRRANEQLIAQQTFTTTSRSDTTKFSRSFSFSKEDIMKYLIAALFLVILLVVLHESQSYDLRCALVVPREQQQQQQRKLLLK